MTQDDPTPLTDEMVEAVTTYSAQVAITGKRNFPLYLVNEFDRVRNMERQLSAARRELEAERDCRRGHADNVRSSNMIIANLDKELAADRAKNAINKDEFTEWLCREIPPGTIIGDPKWWAPRIWRAMKGTP